MTLRILAICGQRERWAKLSYRREQPKDVVEDEVPRHRLFSLAKVGVMPEVGSPLPNAAVTPLFTSASIGSTVALTAASARATVRFAPVATAILPARLRMIACDGARRVGRGRPVSAN